MELKPISYLILGMLRLGATSGYAIKKAADASTNAIWSVSLAQIYPALAQLEKHGLVTRHEDPHGARPRANYELTDKGEEALLAWLRSPDEAPIQVRSEGILKFFFADALPREERVDMVHREQERLHDVRTHLHEENPLGTLAGGEQDDTSAPVLVGRFAEAMLQSGEEWLAQLEAQMRAELDTNS